jgi:hypothetical protein
MASPFRRMNDEALIVDYGQGRRLYVLEEDQLRQAILDMTPDIRRDTERLADVLCDLVKLEREKRGLDRPRGTIELYPNRKKKHTTDPDLTGSGWIAGREYRVAAWVSARDKIRIALLPRKAK